MSSEYPRGYWSALYLGHLGKIAEPVVGGSCVCPDVCHDSHGGTARAEAVTGVGCIGRLAGAGMARDSAPIYAVKVEGICKQGILQHL